MSDYYLCLRCETKYPLSGRKCPECGSDRRTRWLDEPARDEPATPRVRQGTRRMPWNWVIPVVAVLLIAGFVRYYPGVLWLQPHTIVIGVAIIIGIVYLLTRSLGSGAIMPESYHYKVLLGRARGDASLAERLIAYERRRNPDAPRVQHIREAIDRLDRDRSW